VISLELDHLIELLIQPFFSCPLYEYEISGSAGMFEVSTPRMLKVSRAHLNIWVTLDPNNLTFY
jgi:hypothetical protein